MIHFPPGFHNPANLDLALIEEKQDGVSFALELAKHRTMVLCNHSEQDRHGFFPIPYSLFYASGSECHWQIYIKAHAT